jgi:serine/threonine protein kinase
VPTESADPVPERRYEIHGDTRGGGAARVYRAWDSRCKRWVALKRFQAPNREIERLRQTAAVLIALRHPNIVTFHEWTDDTQGPFLVMEWLEGTTLAGAIAHGVLESKDFLSVARQLLDGLGAIHAAGLLHLDLKPDNVMRVPLASGGYGIKVLDFGLARPINPLPEQILPAKDAMTGSVHAMAPEQFNREPPDVRTDLYALGCVFYQLLTGTPPFTGETGVDVMISHLRHQVIPLEKLRPDIPAALCSWVMQLLESDPAGRPASAAAALRQLNVVGK